MDQPSWFQFWQSEKERRQSFVCKTFQQILFHINLGNKEKGKFIIQVMNLIVLMTFDKHKG